MTSMTGSTGFQPHKTSTGTIERGGSKGDYIPKGLRKATFQNFTPEMMELFQSLFSQLGPDSYLSRLAGGDEEIFNQIEKPALKQFSGLQGNIASKFSGMGLGGRRSSGFQNTQNQAASDFASQLQSQRHELQRNALTDLFGLSNSLLSQKPYSHTLTDKKNKRSFWEDLALAGAGAAGEYARSGGGGGGGAGAAAVG